MHDDFLSLELVCGQFAAVGHKAVFSRSWGTLLLPWSKVLGFIHTDRALDPEDDLGHCHKVDLFVVLQGLIHPVEESIQKFWIIFKPGGVGEETKWSSVLVKMSVEIVSEEVVELVSSENV